MYITWILIYYDTFVCKYLFKPCLYVSCFSILVLLELIILNKPIIIIMGEIKRMATKVNIHQNPQYCLICIISKSVKQASWMCSVNYGFIHINSCSLELQTRISPDDFGWKKVTWVPQPSVFGSAIKDNTVSRCKKIKTVNQKQETSSALGRQGAKSSVTRSASKRNIMGKQFKLT